MVQTPNVLKTGRNERKAKPSLKAPEASHSASVSAVCGLGCSKVVDLLCIGSER